MEVIKMFNLFKKSKKSEKKQIDTEWMDDYLNEQLLEVIADMRKYSVTFSWPKETVSASVILDNLQEVFGDIPSLVRDIRAGRIIIPQEKYEITLQRKE